MIKKPQITASLLDDLDCISRVIVKYVENHDCDRWRFEIFDRADRVADFSEAWREWRRAKREK